jgi:hypothetical protein
MNLVFGPNGVCSRGVPSQVAGRKHSLGPVHALPCLACICLVMIAADDVLYMRVFSRGQAEHDSQHGTHTFRLHVHGCALLLHQRTGLHATIAQYPSLSFGAVYPPISRCMPLSDVAILSPAMQLCLSMFVWMDHGSESWLGGHATCALTCSSPLDGVIGGIHHACCLCGRHVVFSINCSYARMHCTATAPRPSRRTQCRTTLPSVACCTTAAIPHVMLPLKVVE